MTFILAAAVVALAAPPGELSTEMWQVAPNVGTAPWTALATPGEKTRAVVLIPGLHVHPLRPTKVAIPERRPWQQPKSELVKALAKDSDVFAFGYSQNVSVDEVSQSAGLRDAVTRLRKAGYKEVVLIGHSAGGVIARQFVEQFPDSGVTKVIAVAAPFAGAEVATFKIGYPKVQAPFVKSLTPEARTIAVRANKSPLGKDVQIVCVVCKLKHIETDGLVFIRSQWPEDLQRFGVPIAFAAVNHFDAMQNATSAKTIAELAREQVIRWSPEEVEKARKVLFGEDKKAP